jgi:hypothetical protein
MAFKPGEDLGGFMPIPMHRCPNSMLEEISTLSNLTKGLQLEWSSLCSEVMGRRGVTEEL